MIVEMAKVYVAVRGEDRERLLEQLHQLGVVHVVPVNPAASKADEDIASKMDRTQRVIQILRGIQADMADDIGGIDGADNTNLTDDITLDDVVDEVLLIQQQEVERASRLQSLHRLLEQQKIWGDVKVADIMQLRDSGLKIEFYTIPQEQVEQIEADCVTRLAELEGKKIFVAATSHTGVIKVPEAAALLTLPDKDNPAIRQEAVQIDEQRKQANKRLREMTVWLPKLDIYAQKLQNAERFSKVQNSGLNADSIYALQGWVPVPKFDALQQGLSEAGLDVALEKIEPTDDDTPPTLIAYSKWTKPIKGLFDILGTLPGYSEIDLSKFFMIALPLFAAMLIGDAGYGLVLTLPAVIWYRKLVKMAGKVKIDLLIVIGLTTLVWGIINADYFGVGPAEMARAGGYVTKVNGQDEPDYVAMQAGTDGWAKTGKAMIAIAPLWRENATDARNLLIKISFIFGCLQLVLGHLRRMGWLWPDMRALAEFGWSLVLIAMLGVIWTLFFAAQGGGIVPPWLIITGIVAGLLLVILFSVPDKNPVKRVVFGFASSLLPTIGTFGDTMSYIRLMAVGSASYYIALSFNSLAASVASSAGWIVASPILLFGHSLNIALGLIAIFAHGVRLNMLEFSNSVQVQWKGYAYNPFARTED